MTTSDRMKTWQAALLQAKQGALALRARWERDGRTPRPGDLIEAGLGEGVHLLTLERHPAHPSFVRVAVADERLDAGGQDVVIDASMHPEPMVVRTALTRWVPASALRAPYEACDARVVEAALAAREEPPGVLGESACEVDEDPEHQGYVASIRRGLQRLPVAILAAPRRAEGLQKPGATPARLPLAGASPAQDVERALHPVRADDAYARPLAAQSISSQMLHALQPTAAHQSKQEVPWEGAGTLTAVSAADGAELLFSPLEGAHTPPEVRAFGDDGGEIAIAWVSAPDRSVFASVPRQPWRDGVVRFRVGADPALDVIVAQ